MLIVFLNIVIAVMSQAYEEYQMSHVIDLYQKKIKKNVETEYIYQFFYWKNRDEDLVFLQNCVEDENENNNEW